MPMTYNGFFFDEFDAFLNNAKRTLSKGKKVETLKEATFFSGFTTLKNKQARTIRPPTEVMILLRQIRRQQAEWKLKAGELWSNHEQFVFMDEIGQHVNDRTVYNNFKQAVESIGLPAVRFHDLRHIYAMQLLLCKMELTIRHFPKTWGMQPLASRWINTGMYQKP